MVRGVEKMIVKEEKLKNICFFPELVIYLQCLTCFITFIKFRVGDYY